MGLLASAHPSFGQGPTAPTLGEASKYGIFTSTGLLTNTGAATMIIGNIGTNRNDQNSITGFTTGMYTGTPQIRTLSTDRAEKGVFDANLSLNDILTGTSHGSVLGSETLNSDVYLLAGASTLAGVLVLDGQNDPNAVFIFKITGSLTTANYSNVRLINAATWENVFWQVSGTTSLGSYAGFKGNIVANNAITFMPNALLQGRALTQSGDITLNNSRVTTSAVPLPVELTSFTAEERSEHVLLRWATASERNNAYFAVQSSTDGARYATIGKVDGHGNTSSPQAYAWTDSRVARYAADAIYYRLVQVDADSSKHYSPVRTIAMAPTADMLVQVYPSPSQLPCYLRIEARHAGPATVRLSNALGYLVAAYEYPLVKGRNSLPLEDTRTLAPGVYLVQVQHGTERQTVRLVRQ